MTLKEYETFCWAYGDADIMVVMAMCLLTTPMARTKAWASGAYKHAMARK